MRGRGRRGGTPDRRPDRPPGRYRYRAQAGDQGLATVWAAVTAAILCTVFAVVLALGQVVAARHRAGGAADLAALAAADRALEGAAPACESAEQVAGAQGAEVVRCAVLGEVADVTARVRFGPYTPEIRSRAGPAADAPPPRTGRESGARPSPRPRSSPPPRPAPLPHPERTGGAP